MAILWPNVLMICDVLFRLLKSSLFCSENRFKPDCSITLSIFFRSCVISLFFNTLVAAAILDRLACSATLGYVAIVDNASFIICSGNFLMWSAGLAFASVKDEVAFIEPVF